MWILGIPQTLNRRDVAAIAEAERYNAGVCGHVYHLVRLVVEARDYDDTGTAPTLFADGLCPAKAEFVYKVRKTLHRINSTLVALAVNINEKTVSRFHV